MWCFGRSRRDSNEAIPDAPSYPFATSPINNAAYIPIRLTAQERKSQRLMRGIMMASSYTDKVDIPLAETKRDHRIAKELTSALTGFLTALNLDHGRHLLTEKDFAPFEREIRVCVEACRRYKIMNPDLLRTDYVKFLYMLQDAARPNVKEVLGYGITAPILTVRGYLKERGIESLLEDPDLPLCITPVPKFERRSQQNAALRRKDLTVDRLCKRYAREHGLKADEVELAVRSLNDANNFAQNNSESAEHLMGYLKAFFSPSEAEAGEGTSLAIAEGEDGARLTHEHSRQYMYVLQSLALWKNVSREMFALWVVAENDLLDPEVPYELRETGQGLHRVQKAPRLYKAVAAILEETKRELGQWVGLETIHLGDNQVPNAFNFIDKYGQITRIVVPIIRTIEHIDKLAEDEHKAAYVREIYGSARNAKIAVLRDFFRHGFDGSGGDTLEDAGSCVDGRLTSAWNWCNNIRTKPFYPLFLMAGFTSFDGDLSI